MNGRNLFLSGMGVIYVLSFTSYLVQYQGLHGETGIEPIHKFIERVVSHFKIENGPQGAETGFSKYPMLLWIAVNYEINIDVFMEAVLAIGLLCGVLIASGVHNWVLFSFCFLVYHNIVQVGQKMLTFQWDILIIESGFIAIFYSGLNPFKFSPSSNANPEFRWIVRILSFKLFFMTGMVKLLSGCQTWSELTALDYHFASQCIPTPLSYYAIEYSTVWFRKASLTIVLFSQIFGSILLISPLVTLRRIGVAMQVISMIAIQLTGNYNWFNIHAALLCFSSWERDTHNEGSKTSTIFIIISAFIVAGWLGQSMSFLHVICGISLVVVSLVCDVIISNRMLLVQMVMAVSILSVLFFQSFGNPLVEPVNLLSESVMRHWMNELFPFVFSYLIAAVTVSGFHQILCSITEKKIFETIHHIILTAVAIVFVVQSLYPAQEIHPGIGGQIKFPGKQIVDEIGNKFQTLKPFYGYGLFRRMTGVGENGEVAVPVLVLEYSTDGDVWNEIPLRYGVGPINRSPPWVAPHQPRLDWRMWFAALGNVRSDHWVLSLAARLLQRDVHVENLINFKFDSTVSSTTAIRGVLYHYNFDNTNKGNWWVRTKKSIWMPPITKSNPIYRKITYSSPKNNKLSPCPEQFNFLCDIVDVIRDLLIPIRKDDSTISLTVVLLLVSTAIAAVRFRKPQKGE